MYGLDVTKLYIFFVSRKKNLNLHVYIAVMNTSTHISQEILDLRNRSSPEGSLLRRDQKELLRMLQKIGEICDRHNIRWWLAAGTLLGAARHGGFIPWDDDVDIFVLRKDYRMLEKILCGLQSEEHVFHCMRTDAEYVNSFGKFRKKEGSIQSSNKRHKYYKWKGIGLDVFVIERTSYFAARLSSVVYKNLQYPTLYISNAKIRRLVIRIVEFFCLGIINPLLRLIGLINPRGEYHYALGTGWPKATFFKKDIFPLTKIEFEGVLFPAPKDTDGFLRGEYGDWHQIPSEEAIKKSIHCKEYREEIFGKE